jgi:hypothetical protein
VRAQPFQILNPVTGQYEQTIKPYYPRTIYDSYAMATGVAITGFKPFNNQSSQSLSSYVKGHNVFELNQGYHLQDTGLGPGSIQIRSVLSHRRKETVMTDY